MAWLNCEAQVQIQTANQGSRISPAKANHIDGASHRATSDDEVSSVRRAQLPFTLKAEPKLRLSPKHSQSILWNDQFPRNAIYNFPATMPDSFCLHPLIVAGIFILAGTVKGVTGMGLPTVAMGVLGALMPPSAAASLLLVPSLATNAWQLVTGSSLANLLPRFRLMMLGIVIGTLGGSTLLTSISAQWTTVALGAVLFAYAAVGLLAPPVRIPAHMEQWLSPATGLITGLITGATGVLVIPVVPYLQALGLRKDDLIQALGLSFTVSTLALAAGLERAGAIDIRSVVASSLSVFPALIGMRFGQWVRQRISAAVFRRWFLLCLALLGLDLVIRPFL